MTEQVESLSDLQKIAHMKTRWFTIMYLTITIIWLIYIGLGGYYGALYTTSMLGFVTESGHDWDMTYKIWLGGLIVGIILLSVCGLIDYLWKNAIVRKLKETKLCPQCAERVQASAKICRYCRSSL